MSTSNRPAYKVEELLALRGSASESAVSLEKFPDEDSIKGTSLFQSIFHLLCLTSARAPSEHKNYFLPNITSFLSSFPSYIFSRFVLYETLSSYHQELLFCLSIALLRSTWMVPSLLLPVVAVASAFPPAQAFLSKVHTRFTSFC